MSWFRKPLNIGITIGAAILAVVAAVLIVYGVVTHREAGLLRVCWIGGEAYYVAGETEDSYGACEGFEELVWPAKQIPLTVTAIDNNSDEVFAPGAKAREGLDAAIRDINQQVGFRLLVPVGIRDGSAILVRVRAPMDIVVGGVEGGKGKVKARSPLGRARHFKTFDGDNLYCDSSVYSTVGNLRGEYLVSHHELLHCVGLAHHPNNRASAMYPFTYDDTMWERMQAARMTDGHRSRIRGLYYR